ncbi:MAG TPA: hypothetical protein H9824_07065 [Candidatus Bacteroides pullicola]|uniref:Transmembrane protein n=1 Tax=Candidatus Bacteroides pullicola TaxID=2838475 RepID=A0A9D1ZHT7_9BACE|nr:hypothetical protein [Candidatus Bacteroides pullicola]
MNEEQPKKSLSYASIVLTGIAVGVAISLLGGALDSEFIRLFGIVGPSAWVGHAINTRLYGGKPLKGFKQWAAFIVAALIVTLIFYLADKALSLL